MSYPTELRSQNAELSEGATDGKYKKVVQGRGGVVEDTTWLSREHLDDNWFGIHEVNPKVAPDGLLHPTPSFVTTPPAKGDVVP